MEGIELVRLVLQDDKVIALGEGKEPYVIWALDGSLYQPTSMDVTLAAITLAKAVRQPKKKGGK